MAIVGLRDRTLAAAGHPLRWSGRVRLAGGAPVLLVAHGSRDPRAGATIRALAGAVGARRPGLDVRVAFLDHALPRPAAVLGALARSGRERVTVVPLLLTAAFHRRVDIPAVLAAAQAAAPGLTIALADVLGPAGSPDPSGRGPAQRDGSGGRRRSLGGNPAGGRPDGLLLAALSARLRECGDAPPDAVVLAAAGTTDPTARDSVDRTAVALGELLSVPCRVAYASAAGPRPGAAVAALRAGGAHRVAVAAYFLAPGRLYDLAAAESRAAGASVVAPPLADAPDLASLVLARIDAATGQPWPRSDGVDQAPDDGCDAGRGQAHGDRLAAATALLPVA